MKIQEKRDIFNENYYRWALSEANRQIVDSFSLLDPFKSGITWRTKEFFSKLCPPQDRIYVHALLKQHHSAARKRIGESLTTEEQSLLESGASFRPAFPGRDTVILEARRLGKVVQFASKRALRDAIESKIRAEFGDATLRAENLGSPKDLRFEIAFGQWTVLTTFWFGRNHTTVSYRHLIASINKVESKHTAMPAEVLNYACWIGLCPIEWEYVYKDEIDEGSNALVKQCRQVIDAMPEILNGL